MREPDEKTKDLLDRLDRAETDEEIKEIGELLLKDDPSSPYGKLALWESLDDEGCFDSLYLLREALNDMRASVEARDVPPIIEEDRDAQVYCTLLMNLGYTLHAQGDFFGALEMARELAAFDDEGHYPSRTLLYRSMLDLGLYKEILETLELDDLESVVGEHARAIALIESGADAKEVREAVDYAISLAPDVPFYVLGIWDVPDDDEIDEDMEDDIQFASFLAEPWGCTDERLVALSAPAFMLGYLTERLDDEREVDTLRAGYRSAGLLDKVDGLKDVIMDMEDEGKDLEEIDAYAIGEMGIILDKLMG